MQISVVSFLLMFPSSKVSIKTKCCTGYQIQCFLHLSIKVGTSCACLCSFCAGVWRSHGFVYISVVGPMVFPSSKSVNMLTSLKLNAVQVIKFTGDYNYRSMGGI